MKKIILLLIAFLPFITNATNYTSVSGGGNWSNSATWSPTGVPGSGDNVTIASNVTLNANESCNNITINSGYTFSGSSNTLSVYGNFTNNGTFTYSTGTVSFVGSSAQTIGGGSSGITFYNLTVNSTSTTTLAQVITVNNNLDIAAGTLDCEQYQITGNATGTITVGAGATLILGSTSSSTNVTVPTNYTVAHASVSSTSTIVYQANTNSQSIASAFTYGNLTVSGGSITVVKAPGGTSAITVSGNLLVNVVEFNMTTKNLNVTGNVTNDGAISFSTGAFNIGGNFTNSGTYTYGTGTLTFDGSANQQLNGTTTPGLYNLTINQNSTTDSVFFNAPITVSNTLTSTKGVLDCKKHQLTNSSTPALTVSPSSPSICYGSSTTLSTSGYSTYIWAPSSSLSASTGSSVTASPTVTTTYTVYGSTSSIYTCALGTDVGTVNFCNSSCGSAIALGSLSVLNDIPVKHAYMWYSFTASGNIADVFIRSYADNLPGRVIKAILYKGSCSSLIFIKSDSISSMKNYGDSLLAMNNNNIISGDTYYLELFTDDSTTGRTYNLYLDQATSTCPSPPSCDVVSNGNFSTESGLPSGYSQVNAASCWYGEPSHSTPDYYNSSYNTSDPISGVPDNYENVNPYTNTSWCTSGTPDHTGTNGGYAGLIAYGPITNGREYIQEQLTSPMVAGYTYNVTFYTFLSPASEYEIGSGDMGMYISTCSPTLTTPFDIFFLLDCGSSSGGQITPQITGQATSICPTCASSGFNASCSWGSITGQYTAVGGEQYITIGNFNNDSHTTISSNPGYPTSDNPYGIYVSYYYIDDVSITKSASINSSTGNYLCSGDNATLSVSGGWTSYSWSTGATTSSITVSPTSTTTYSVSTSDGTCNATATYTLNVTTQPFVSPSSASICAGDSVQLSAVGADTYTWSPSSTLSASSGTTVIATPTATTTYAVSGTGCYADQYVTVTINSNCCTTDCQAYANSVYYFYTYPSGLTISNGTYSSSLGYPTIDITADCPESSLNTAVTIQGTFTIDRTCTIDSCNVAMGKYAEIIIDSLDTLIIHKARLYACDTMWQGIIVKPGGTLIVDSNSIIEDAQIGIEGRNSHTGTSVIQVTSNSLMNNNFYDIQIDPYSQSTQYPLTLEDVVFTTSSDPFSPDAYLKPPYTTGTITSKGIYLDSVRRTILGEEAITIGTPGSTTYTCNFSNMNYGVFANCSDFAVFNNNFNNLEGYTVITHIVPIGVAVYANAPAYDSTNVATWRTAIIGSSGADYANSIINCYRGVDVTEYLRLQVDSNYFYTSNNNINSHHNYPYGDHAVYYKTEGHDSIQFLLSHNIIENFNTGIHVAGLLPTEIGSLVGNNLSSFINSNYIHVSSTNLFGTGILAENLYNNYPGIHTGGLYIQNNTIDSADVCIQLNELSDYLYTYVNSNPELYVLPSVSTDNTFKAGIYLTDCNEATYISDNPEIIATGTYINSTAADADTDVVGINAYITESQICGNTLYNLGQGIKFTGDCQNTAVYNNSVDNMYDGFVLDMVGVINQQGSSVSPIGDVWGTYTDFAHTNGQTYTYSSVALNSPIYLLTGTLPSHNGSNDGPADTYNASGALNIATGSNPTCTSPTVKNPSPLHRALSATGIDTAAMIWQMKQVIYDSVPLTGFVSESQFMMQQTIYNTLSNSPALLAKDTALQNFYNRNQSRSIGIIYNMTHSIQSGNYTGAKTINNAFVPKTTIEQNYKDVNNIMLSTYGSGIDSATSSQIATLQNIASQCPLSGGRAVFQARTLLNALLNTNVQYYNDCTGNSGHILERKEQSPVANARIYPNPANSELTVEVDMLPSINDNICLFDVMGKRIICQELATQLTTIYINNVPSGIYFYRITDSNGDLIKSDKIMIVH